MTKAIGFNLAYDTNPSSPYYSPSPEGGWTKIEKETFLMHLRDEAAKYGKDVVYYHGDAFGDTSPSSVDATRMSEYGLWVMAWHWHGFPQDWAWQPHTWDLEHIIVVHCVYDSSHADDDTATTHDDLISWYDGTTTVSGGNYDYIMFNLLTCDSDPDDEQLSAMKLICESET